jgi:hypothetical protein
MIEQLAHDICFVIILHILDIPLVHRSEWRSNTEWGGWWGRAGRWWKYCQAITSGSIL